jgi:signal transduction histidine kinase
MIESERLRISRDLHAGAGQPLAGIQMNLAMLEDLVVLPESAREVLDRVRRLAESALEQVRAVSHKLQPPNWQMLSVEDALRGLVGDCGLDALFAQVRIDIRDLPVAPEYPTRVAIYRCAQECLSNVIRHSRATRVEFTLRPEARTILLRVADNGCGIEKRGSSGMGLRAMREHAAEAGAETFLSTGNTGTTIEFRFPLRDGARNYRELGVSPAKP